MLISMFENMLIKMENENPKNAQVLITEDHIKHIKSHIKYFYRSGMTSHILSHVYYALKKKKAGLSTFTLKDFL